MKESKGGAKKAATPSKKATAKQTSATSSQTSNKSAENEAAKAPVVVDREPSLPATHGKIGIFGGPKDRSVKPEDKLALPTGPHGVYEKIRSLNPKSFYCSMRWNYHVEHMTPEEVRRWWANKKILLTNPKTGSAVVVRAVDYGPHENTGLALGISPGAAAALGVESGDEVDIALADSKSHFGKQ